MVAAHRVLAAQRIGRAIVQRRGIKDLSQRELAKRIGMTQAAIVAMEAGDSYPHKKTQIKLESVLELPMGKLEEIGETGILPDAESAVSQDAADGLLGMAQATLEVARQAVTTLPDPANDVYVPMAMNIVRTLSTAIDLMAKGFRSAAMGEAMKLIAEMNQVKDSVMQALSTSPSATVGHKLYVWRRASGVDQRTVADMTGIEVARIAELENSEPPTPGECRILAKIVGV